MDVALEKSPQRGCRRCNGPPWGANLSGKRTEFEGWTAIRIHMAGDNLENSRSGCFLRGVPPVASGCAAPLFQSHTAARGVVFLFAAKKKKGYGTKCQWINWLIW